MNSVTCPKYVSCIFEEYSSDLSIPEVTSPEYPQVIDESDPAKQPKRTGHSSMRSLSKDEMLVSPFPKRVPAVVDALTATLASEVQLFLPIQSTELAEPSSTGRNPTRIETPCPHSAGITTR